MFYFLQKVSIYCHKPESWTQPRHAVFLAFNQP